MRRGACRSIRLFLNRLLVAPSGEVKRSWCNNCSSSNCNRPSSKQGNREAGGSGLSQCLLIHGMVASQRVKHRVRRRRHRPTSPILLKLRLKKRLLIDACVLLRTQTSHSRLRHHRTLLLSNLSRCCILVRVRQTRRSSRTVRASNPVRRISRHLPRRRALSRRSARSRRSRRPHLPRYRSPRRPVAPGSTRMRLQSAWSSPRPHTWRCSVVRRRPFPQCLRRPPLRHSLPLRTRGLSSPIFQHPRALLPAPRSRPIPRHQNVFPGHALPYPMVRGPQASAQLRHGCVRALSHR